MDERLAARALEMYGVKYTRLLPAQQGYRNLSQPVELDDGRRLNLILYKREPGIAARMAQADRMAQAAAGQGLPVRTLADSRVLRLRSARGERYAGLYHFLPGATIPWEAYTMEHLKIAGHALGELHAALRTAPPLSNLVADEYRAINARVQRYFADPGVRRAIRDKLQLTPAPRALAQFDELLAQTKRLPGQNLHMDFVRGNLLFDGKLLTGILDFEKAAFGPPIYDLARTLAFLLVDCKYKTSIQTRKYFLQSGYSKRGRGQIDQPQLLEQLVNFFLLHDFYKFLRHNPYESLLQNEHFTRTRDQLLTTKIIQHDQ